MTGGSESSTQPSAATIEAQAVHASPMTTLEAQALHASPICAASLASVCSAPAHASAPHHTDPFPSVADGRPPKPTSAGGSGPTLSFEHPSFGSERDASTELPQETLGGAKADSADAKDDKMWAHDDACNGGAATASSSDARNAHDYAIQSEGVVWSGSWPVEDVVKV